MQSTSGSGYFRWLFVALRKMSLRTKALRSGFDGTVEVGILSVLVCCCGASQQKKLVSGLLTKRPRQTCVAIVEGVRKPRSPQLNSILTMVGSLRRLTGTPRTRSGAESEPARSFSGSELERNLATENRKEKTQARERSLVP
jgi:hypothetical protein